jgi:hypothetical protein
LAVLFGGARKKTALKISNLELDKEGELMEALALEDDTRPDDRAIQCSDDEYWLSNYLFSLIGWRTTGKILPQKLYPKRELRP